MGFDISAYLNSLLYILLMATVLYIGCHYFFHSLRLIQSEVPSIGQAARRPQVCSVSPVLTRRYLRRKMFSPPDDEEERHALTPDLK